ncbi:MAG: AEC family transporter [Saccharofermentans sp.]|nr:AEC family transporter [Saccharofermentans sp.]
MSPLDILQQMAVILILVSIGIFLCRRGVTDKLTSKQISTIVMDVCNPALILASILSGDITADRFEVLIAVGLGLIFYTILVLLGFVLPKMLRVEADRKKIFNVMTVYTNTGFIGIPVAKAILPPNAIIYVVVINVLYSLLFYTHGITILSGNKSKPDLKKILSPGTVMAVLSLVIFAFDIKLPEFLSSTISYTGNATVFLSMILLGAAIYRSNLKEGFKDGKIWAYIVIRLILVPILIFSLFYLMKMNRDAVLALSLMACVPVGNLPLIQAEKMGEDTSTISLGIAVTTVISLFTITALMTVFSLMC